MVMTRHEFLEQLHLLLRPTTYLEVGVQYGTSLALAHAAEVAIGIDPNPLIIAGVNQQIFHMTSDRFFEPGIPGIDTILDSRRIDLAFIDGMHLFEYALRDFLNIEKYCHGGSVVVFDDVLPRNQHEARRMNPGDPVHGDWTGDVWKVGGVLKLYHTSPHLHYKWVDTQPTGVLVVTGFPDRYNPWSLAGDIIEINSRPVDVPDDVINRTAAWQPDQALEQIAKETTTWRS